MTLFELVASLKLDDSEYEKGLTDSEKKAFHAGQKIGDGLKTLGGGAVGAVKAIGTVGSAALKVGTTAVKGISMAVGATSAALTPIVKQAVSAYGEQQQLVGGMETLYKDSASTMIQYANEAYKTAGMSANEYMRTATESSAAMINALGGDTAKAAEKTNMAIIDMSDNANKMGTDIQSLQNAYRGFSRGNFTMLDNLSLGFSGTKDGMQSLLDKAQELSGVKYDISSYADIVDAIHVVQTEMGITGTTSAEAADTISGSVGSMKAAWENLMAGLGSGQDIAPLIDNLVKSVEGAVKNLLPVVEKALNGVVSLISKLAPVIAEKLPPLINELLPTLISAATSLITTLAQSLPTLIPALLPPLIEGVTAIFIAIAQNLPQIVTALVEQLPTIISAIVQAIVALAPALLQAGVALFQSLWAGFSNAFPEASGNISNFIDRIKEAWDGLKQAFSAIVEYLRPIFEAISGYLSAFWELVSTIVGLISDFIRGKFEENSAFITAFLDYFKMIFAGAWEFIKGSVSTALSAIQIIITTVFGVLKGIFQVFTAVLKGDWQGAWDAIKNTVQVAKDGILKLFTALKDGLFNTFHNIISAMKTWGSDMIDNLISGIKEKIGAVKDAIGGVAETIASYIHFSEPDVGALSNFHTYAPDMMREFAKGITDNADLIANAVNKSFDIEPYINASYNNRRGNYDTSNNVVDRANAQPVPVTVVLQGDAGKFFTAMRAENDVYTKANGVSAFA